MRAIINLLSGIVTGMEQVPRIGIGVIVIRDGKVLLGQRKGAHGIGMWAPPGGHLEFGETVKACAKRELLEETGMGALSVQVGPWTENIMENKHYITLFTFVEAIGEPKLLEPEKCAGWEWFDCDDLPEPIFPTVISFIEQYGPLAKAYADLV